MKKFICSSILGFLILVSVPLSAIEIKINNTDVFSDTYLVAAGTAIAGDCVGSNGHPVPGALLKAIGSLLDVSEKNPKTLQFILGCVRAASYLTLPYIHGDCSDEISRKAFVFRLVSCVADQWAKSPRFSDKTNRSFFNILKSISSTYADYLTGNNIVATASILSACAEVYKNLNIVDCEWYKKLFATEKPVVTERPVVQVNNQVNNIEEKEEICPICRDKIKEKFTTSCGHTFCKKCIAEWAKMDPKELDDVFEHNEEYLAHCPKNTTCPICRKDILSEFRAKP